MGSCISGRGGGNVIHDFWYLGKEGEGEKIFFKNVILLTYVRSVLLFIKQYSDSMCFSPFLAENYESYLIYVK